MLCTTFGNRTGAPAFFDMGPRFKPKTAGYFGGAFRIGDRAAAYIWLGDWRLRNPDRRLVVIEDSVMHGTEHSRHLDGNWLFRDIADELWQVQRRGENFPPPPGQNLYHVSVWRIWKWLQTNNKFVPTIRPKPESVEKVQRIFHAWALPKHFITVQPLFDAMYNRHRNAPVSWWNAIILDLARYLPVVVLGSARNRYHLPATGHNIYPLWKFNCTAMDSLAAISVSKLLVGGETGTTIWAPILGVPTLACYQTWELPNSYIDTRPFSFGASVSNVSLCAPARFITEQVYRVVN